jgi:hypothetical protein
MATFAEISKIIAGMSAAQKTLIKKSQIVTTTYTQWVSGKALISRGLATSDAVHPATPITFTLTDLGKQVLFALTADPFALKAVADAAIAENVSFRDQVISLEIALSAARVLVRELQTLIAARDVTITELESRIRELIEAASAGSDPAKGDKIMFARMMVMVRFLLPADQKVAADTAMAQLAQNLTGPQPDIDPAKLVRTYNFYAGLPQNGDIYV